MQSVREELDRIGSPNTIQKTEAAKALAVQDGATVKIDKAAFALEAHAVFVRKASR